MQINLEQQAMLAGDYGRSTRKAMEILTALGEIYGAEQLVPVASVQIAGVSYDNLGEAGLHWLAEMAEGGGKARVLATLNPAGIDVENWGALGISDEFAARQRRVIDAFRQMGVVTTCTCTPYLTGNLPHFGEHLAWAESSAVCYANAVLGARTNREGGPSALAAALTGYTPEYGLHMDEHRQPEIRMTVTSDVQGTHAFGALGKAIGEQIERLPGKPLPYLSGIHRASLDELKSFCASLATYGGLGMFHMEGITPEAGKAANLALPAIEITAKEITQALASMSDAGDGDIDFASLGCPHLTIEELAHLADLLEGKQVTKTFWITTARPTKQIADRMGYTRTIEASGAVIAADTCCVVAPIRGRFHGVVTDSAKACYYAAARHGLRTGLRSFEQVVEEALR